MKQHHHGLHSRYDDVIILMSSTTFLHKSDTSIMRRNRHNLRVEMDILGSHRASDSLDVVLPVFRRADKGYANKLL